jgi:hypothetical protein
MATWNILWRFGMFYHHLVHFVCIRLAHFSGIGIIDHEKSGNPEADANLALAINN